MTDYVQLPNGSYFPLKEGENAREAMMAAREMYPDAFGALKQEAPKAKQKEGIFADVAASAKNLLNIGKTGIGALTGDTTEAAQAGAQRQQKLGEEYKSGVDIDKITGKFDKGEYLGAAGEALSQAPSAIASILPSVGQEMGAAALGRLGGGALGSLAGPGGTAIGAQVGQYALPLVVNFVQALGSQAQEKVKAQVQAGEKPDVDALELAPYAAGNAALNLVGTKIAMPSIFKKAIGQQVAAETGDAARKALLAEASKVAGRGTWNTIGRGVGGFAFGELPTEVLQDVVDRAAIGKPLDDDEAIKQYRDTAFSMLLASPIGGGFGVQQRSQARGVVAKEEAQQQAIADARNRQLAQQEAEQKTAAAAQAEAERKADPAYASQFLTDYETRLAEFQGINTKKLGKDATFEEREILAENKAKKAELGKQLSELTPEYRQLKALKAAADAKAAPPAPVAPIPVEAQTDMFGGAAPIVPAAPALVAPVDYREESRVLTDRLDDIRTQAQAAKDPAKIVELGQQYTQIKTALDAANKRVGRPIEKQIELAQRKMQLALDEGEVDLAAKQAAKLVELQSQVTPKDTRQREFGKDALEPVKDTFSESKSQFGRRMNPSDQRGANLQAVQSQEEDALQESRQLEEQQRIDAAREQKIAPEVLALQRIQNRPTQTMGLPGFGTAPEEKLGSAAMGQMEQSLRGVEPGQELLFTADDVPAAPKVQKGPGGGFRLFNEQGERQLTNEQAYRSLSERLAIASSNPDLSDEAYNFLRRAETVLPQVNTRLETARKEPIKKGEGTLAAREYAADVASSESFYKLLDEQLARIERGEEGTYQSQRYVNEPQERAKGTTADVTPSEGATPYQLLRNRGRNATPTDLKAEKRRITALKKFPNAAKQPEGERDVVNVPGAPVEKRARQTTGRTIRGEAPSLSMAAELEPLIRAQEQARGQGPIAEGQKELFPSEGSKLGITRASFKSLMESKVVQKMREAVQKDKGVVKQAKNLPALQARVDALSKKVKEMQDANVEYSKAMSVIRHNKNIDKLGKERDAANAALLDMGINRAELAGRIEELMQLRGSFDAQLNAMGEFKNTELATRFEPLLSEYNTVQKELATLNTDLASLDETMKMLETELRVEKARADLARLNPVTVSKETLDAAKEELRAAQLNAGVAEAEISKAETVRKTAEAKARRETEAVARAEKEKNRINVDKEYQRRLEAAYGTSATGQEYNIITMAQREAQQMRPVAFTVEEQKKLSTNPNAVLAGLRSRITGLERIMQASYAKSKEFNEQKLVPSGQTVEQLLAAYNAAKSDDVRATLKYKLAATRVAELSVAFKNAKSADERADIEPRLEAAEREYDEQAANLQEEPIMWKGRAGQMKELSALYNKADRLEADIAAGRVVQEKDFQRKSPTLKPSTGEKEGAAAAAQATEVKEATQRATAPTTTGEAGVTRMKGADLRKPKATVFSSKGIGQERLSKDQQDAIKRAEVKQATGKPLDAFDQQALNRKKTIAEGIKSTNNPPEATDATGATSSVQTLLNEDGQEALADGRTLDVLRNIIATTDVPFIRENAEKLLGFVSRTRIMYAPDITVKGEAVPAAYNAQENAVGVRPGFESESNVIHELTHAATMRALEGPESKLNADQLAAKREITGIYNRLTANGTLTGQYAAKNVKEFVSEVQSNVDLRNKLGSTKMFGSTALRKIVDAFLRLIGMNPSYVKTEEAQAVIERLYMQSGKLEGVTDSANVFSKTQPKYESENALTRLASQVIAGPKAFKDRFVNNAALKAEMETVDMRAGLREALKTGDTKNYQQAMYSVTKADQKMAVTYSTLQNGAPELYTDEKGFHGIKSERRGDKPTAVNIFEAVSRVPGENEQAKMALATTYMIAQRAANKGLTKLDLGNLGVTEEQLAEAMAFVNSNAAYKNSLENVREKYNKYNAGLIKFLADTGAIPKKTADEFLKDGDYVPYYRVREDGVAELVFGGEKTVTIGDIRHQPYLAELKGGDTKILPLSESLPRNTMLLMDKALTNMATKNVAYALQDIGKGKGPIDEKTGKPKNLMPIHSGRNPGGASVIVFNQEPDPKDPKDDGQRWLRVETDGTIMGGIPAELVVKSLEGAHLTLPSFLKLGGIAGDLLRSGVTRTPLYIMRQLIRDPMAATFTAGLNYGPLSAIYKATKEFVKMQSGNSVTAGKLIEKGLIQSQIFNGDPDDLSKFALQLASGKDQGVMDSLFAMADRAAMSADAATRSLVYENAIKNGLSEVEADMMVMESMNFNKRGLSPTVQYASRLIPFFNAQIQGLNVLYKAARGNMPFEEQQRIKQKFYNNGMMLMATGLVYAMAMQDDEYYKNAKPKDRYSNFFLYIPGVKEPLKIPIPYEAGWFFSAAVATVDAIVGEVDTKQQLTAIRDILLSSIPGYSSAGIPQLIKPVFEVWTNKNFFSGNDIESVGMQNKRTEDRYVAATTEMAKAMSRAAPILSPVQIEHIVRGYLGVMPIAAAAAANDLFAKESAVEKPARRLTDVPLIGSAFQRQYGGADLDVVYKLAQDAMETNTSFNSLKRTGTPEDIRAFREEHKAELRAAPIAGTFKQNMARLKLQEDLITNRMPLTPEEKRARIDKIDKARQDLAETFMKRIKAIENQP